MLSFLSLGTLIPLFALNAYALPAPDSSSGFLLTDTAAICALPYSDPKKAWVNSGASVFLDGFLKNNSDKNWAANIDQKTTLSGSQGASVLDCTDAVGNCGAPSVNCPAFTPPVLWHVRNAMAACHGMFEALLKGLQDSTITTGLQVDKLVSDFGPKAQDSSNLFGYLNSAFSVAAGLAAAEPGINGPLSVVSGVFGFLAINPSSKPVNPTATINVQLATIYDASRKQIASTLATVFGGGPNTGNLPGLLSQNGETQNIAKFFSGGKSLVDNFGSRPIGSLIDPIIEKGQLLMKQALVVSLLGGQGYYVFIDTSRKSSDCNSITGSRFIDNQCFTIEKFDASSAQSKPIDRDTALKLDNSDYQIDLPAFYRNAAACTNAHSDFSGKPATQSLPTDGSLPECFFSIPVLKADKTPCKLVAQKDNLPAQLNINRGSCTVHPVGRPVP